MLILVRHGRTPANAAGLIQGHLDQDLDEVGVRQALAVSKFVMDAGPIAQVVSSPLRRAVETAEAFGMPVEIDDRWMELAYGEFEGVPYTDIAADAWQGWRTDADFAPEGGESLGALDARVRSACDDLTERASAGNVVVVSHVSPMKAAVGWALGVGIEIATRSHLDQASVCRIAFRSGRPILQKFNEIAPANLALADSAGGGWLSAGRAFSPKE